MAEGWEQLKWNLAAASLGCVRIVGPGGEAYIPMNVKDSGEEVRAWEASSVAMHANQEPMTLPPKPEDTDVSNGDVTGFTLRTV